MTAIVPMRREDVPAVAALESVLFAGDSPWTEQMFYDELAAARHYWVLRGEDDVLLGYAGLAVGFDDADVQTIGVAAEARGRGLGRALLHTLLDAAGARVVHLEVRVDNAIAIALYESEGFERCGIRRRYYHPSGADAFTMIRPIPASAGDTGSVTPGQ